MQKNNFCLFDIIESIILITKVIRLKFQVFNHPIRNIRVTYAETCVAIFHIWACATYTSLGYFFRLTFGSRRDGTANV